MLAVTDKRAAGGRGMKINIMQLQSGLLAAADRDEGIFVVASNLELLRDSVAVEAQHIALQSFDKAAKKMQDAARREKARYESREGEG